MAVHILRVRAPPSRSGEAVVADGGAANSPALDQAAPPPAGAGGAAAQDAGGHGHDEPGPAAGSVWNHSAGRAG